MYNSTETNLQKTLQQKIGRQNTEYVIDDAGLKKVTHAKFGASEFHIPFEQIRTNKTFVLEQNKSCLGLAIFFAGIFLLTFIMGAMDMVEATALPWWFAISISLFAIYYKSRAHKLYVETNDGKVIEFTLTKETHLIVTEFVDLMMQERNRYLISKYAQLNKNLEYGSQLENLNWLLNSRAMTKEQYDGKVSELNTLFHTTASNKPIGFATNN
jgi:hypothetical protein